jgi:hypothetical protein
MNDLKELLDREARRVSAEPDALDTVLRLRDRKRRNQRIAATVVGIALFPVAIGVVATGLPFDQSQTEVVPGGAGTGPTGIPTAPDAGWDGLGIPPEGVALSTPAEGELIDQWAEIHVGYVYVYADGRVIWHVDGDRGLGERRLTPEGVDLVRSGDVEPSELRPWTPLPAGIWADEPRPYAPARFAICTWRDSRFYPTRFADLLPAPAQALLRGKEHRFEGVGDILGDPVPVYECFEVATEEARALDQILIDAGVERQTVPDSGDVSFVLKHRGERVLIDFTPLFPDGLWHYMGG